MHKENGYAPRRDEVFIRTHQSKKKPQTQEIIGVINKIEEAINDHPELLEKTIQQGDVLAHVLGKEKNGYVRCVGLGPSAGTIGMLGAQRLKSTKLQMAELEAEKAWRANDLLKEQVDEITNNAKSQKSQIDALIEEVSQLRMMVSQSNTGNNNSMLNLDHLDSVGESAAWDEDQQFHEEEERLDREIREATENFESMKARAALLRNKKESAVFQNRVAAQHQKREAEILEERRKQIELQKKEKEVEDLQMKEVEQLQNKKEAELLRKKKEVEKLQKQNGVQVQKKLGAAITQKNHQQGKEVMLYNVFRDHSIPVAKATIVSTDRKKIVGGRELGAECCEVVVDYIMKKDAILPRPVGKVTTIGHAQGRTIAWLYKHMEVQKSMAKQASPPQEE
nr:uncharacterized protein LOC127338165 [Lolium perenne]